MIRHGALLIFLVLWGLACWPLPLTARTRDILREPSSDLKFFYLLVIFPAAVKTLSGCSDLCRTPASTTGDSPNSTDGRSASSREDS